MRLHVYISVGENRPAATVLKSGCVGFRVLAVPANVHSNFGLSQKYSSNISVEVKDRFKNDPPFSLNANSSSGEKVSYILVSGPIALSDNIVTIIDTGTVVVRASSTGNAYMNGPENEERIFHILANPKINQVVGY